MSQKRIPDQVVRAAGILLMNRSAESVEFLLMRHADRWDLPKGHCEPGESFLETALRETEEETGVSATEISIDPVFHCDINYAVTYEKKAGNQIFQKQVRYFLGWLDSKPELSLTEHFASQWFPWSPPHQIQTQTIDPLLAAIADHLS